MSTTNDPSTARSTDDKRALLLQALQEKAGGLSDVHPVSLFQEGLVFLSHLQPDSSLYNMPYALRLKGQLDRAALEQSLHEILRRHIPLRAVFKTTEDGQLRQIIQPWRAQELPFSDLFTFPPEQRQSQARRILTEEGQSCFNLAEGPLFRAHLLRVNDDEHWFLFVIHHIAFDLLSIDLFFQELAALYTAYVAGQPSPLREIAFSYANFARWQRQWLRGAEAAAQLAYWQQQLSGPLPILELPADFSRRAEPTGKGALYTMALSPTLPDALKALGQQEGATLFMTLLAAFGVLLSRLTLQEDIIIGTPTANRDRAELMHIVGLLINTLAIRIDLSGTPTFRQVLKRVQRTALDAYANQQVPFPLLVETVQPDRSTRRTPIFQVMFALEQAPARVVLPGLAADFIEHHTETAKFDLTLVIREDTTGLRAAFEYNTDLFSAATIQRLAGHFGSLLLSVTQNPDQTITTLPYLSEIEQRQLLVEWNATTSPYPTHEQVAELIERQVNSDPTAIAVVFHDEQYTYGELNRRSNQLAHYLRRLGIGHGVPVGICLERSFEMVVALLGVLKAGGAYVPMDASHPRERLAFLIDDARIPLVLTQHHFLSRLPTEQSRSICLDTDWADIAQEPIERCTIESLTDTLAYIIYTSGSTGKPKGVAVTHKNLLNLVFWHMRTYALTTADRTTQLAGVSFDASVWEIWPTLVAGARLYLVDEEVRLSPPRLRDWLSAQHITVSFVPTPLAEELLALPWPNPIALRYLLTGGDRLHRYPAAGLPFQLVNHYGPTECTVLATAATIIAPGTEGATNLPTIGRAIANTKLYVLDRYAQLMPIGVPGELYIGGASVASGYLHQPELTATRFITNPFSTDPSDRLYKTGDLVRYLPDGTLEFIGRSDDQVKIRGFRIELGEIESALLKHPLICEAAATVQSHPDGEPFIAAYIVTENRQSIADASLRTFLQQMLPEYMLPVVYTQVETLPLTANGGKVDRRALPKVALPSPHASVPETAHNSPEEALIAMWKAILGRENVGLQDNFFELGGHSLLLGRLQEQIRLKLQKEIPLLDFFKYPTVTLLAHHLSVGMNALPPTLPTVPVPTALPASDSSSLRSGTTEIAVIGMAGRFPGAHNIETFWQNLCDGLESISRFSVEELVAAGADLSQINDPHFVPAKGIIEDADCFDAAFFGITPRDAESLDPQQRVFLECAAATLEHAGYDTERYTGQIGIYAGSSMNTYFLNNLYPNKAYLNMVGMYQISIGNEKDSLTTRTAYKLNLKGPAVTVQTACSTSLVAVHMACQALLNGECDMALAGGVSIQAPLKEGYLYQDGDILSPDGHCRAFDADARGTVSGNGVGLILLKPLRQALHDGDSIHAVIKGTAVNNDGAVKVGYTAPSPDGQASVIIKALDAAQVSADTITYVEAHGTGTVLGDPIEIEGLTKSFRARGAQENHFCAIGSVKSNIGHLDAASGITGTLKTILALKQRQIPPSLHFVRPNAAIDFAQSPFFVNVHLSEWSATPAHPRRAGVSSFGIGGTNAHIVLEEAPAQAASSRSARTWQLLGLSAFSLPTLEVMTEQLLSHLKQQPDVNLADVAYTLQVGRKELPYRKMMLIRDGEDITQFLKEQGQQYIATHHASTKYALVFLFPGQGSQYVQMARELYASEALFRAQVDYCAEQLKPELGLDLRHILFPDGEQLAKALTLIDETQFTQPAIFVIEYALAHMWLSWGVRPQAMIGHSIGEYVAACLAGVFSLEDALTLVAARGRLTQLCPKGAMLAVELSEQDLLPLLSSELSFAAINGPRMTVAAGPYAAIDALARRLQHDGIRHRQLHTSHAFHSAMMEAALEPFLQRLKQVSFSQPQVPFISNVTGTWITAEEATDPHYWVKHMRQTIRFADGLSELFAHAQSIFLEVGPGQTLSTLTRQHPAKGDEQVVLSSLRRPQEQQSDLALLLRTLGRLWLLGQPVSWNSFWAQEQRSRVPLPTYPFERQRYWIAPPAAQPAVSGSPPDAPLPGASRVQASIENAEQSVSHQHDEGEAASQTPMTEIEEMIAAIWQEVLGISQIGMQDNFFELGGDSLRISRVASRLREILHLEIAVTTLFEAQTIAALAKQIEDMLIEALECLP